MLGFALAAAPVSAQTGGGAEAEAPAATPPAAPTPEPRTPIQLRGEVVDTACFVMGNRRGSEHRQCAIACARAGGDLAILDERTKKLYVVVLDRRFGEVEHPLLPYVAHRVDARGELLEFGDLPAVTISSVKSLGPVR